MILAIAIGLLIGAVLAWSNRPTGSAEPSDAYPSHDPDNHARWPAKGCGCRDCTARFFADARAAVFEQTYKGPRE